MIYTAEHLNALGAEPNDYDKCFKLMVDIDLSGYVYDRAVIAPDVNDAEGRFQWTPFTGVFDGNERTVSHLTIAGGECLALFGQLGPGATLSNLRLEAVDVNGTGNWLGGLVGSNGYWNSEGGIVTNCYSTGSVTGGLGCVGGLAGINSGSIINCRSTATVTGSALVGGLVGDHVADYVGSIISSFWDIETSGATYSAGGVGETTAEMQTASTFLDAGWDFVDETENGTEDIWKIVEGQDYPRLWWKLEGEN